VRVICLPGALRLPLSLFFLLAAAPPLLAASDFELVDGDRVVLLGGTIIEREQSSGYWEAMLTSRWPDRNILFRNLGWSGDNVFGEARSGFGTTADGFRELKEHVTALRPTVLLVCYGANESFAGQTGVANFEQGLQTLLDTLAETKARIVLISPSPQEEVGKPLPAAAAHNRDLALYRDALSRTAADRKLQFVDLFALLGGEETSPRALTDNGLHFTPRGYRATARTLATGMGITAPETPLELKPQGVQQIRLASLPQPPAPAAQSTDPKKVIANSAPPTVVTKGLSAGRHVLKIDGQPVAAATSAEWAKGRTLDSGPDIDQAEALRQAIVAKNRLYFYRWRPQNITYLTGFRKHEQGQNAKEVVEFDPLIAEQEAKIAMLRVPVERSYEFVQESEAGQ